MNFMRISILQAVKKSLEVLRRLSEPVLSLSKERTDRHCLVDVIPFMLRHSKHSERFSTACLYLTGLLLALSLAAAGIAIAADDLVYGEANSPIQRSDEKSQESSALHRLALGLSSGPEAMRALRGSQSENNDNKDRLELSLVEMECNIDRIANYVACYSSPVHSETEAETLFAKLLYHLEAALPSDSWRGNQKAPGIASSRSYTYQDQRSNAHIDIDIVARPKPQGPNAYIVSIFGWPGYKLAGYDDLERHP